MSKCRINKTSDLELILDLGHQAYTGIFPELDQINNVTKGSLRLGISHSSGLVQLMESFPTDQLYGDNYGYRSGLNTSMIEHLQSRFDYLSQIASISADSTIVDIGSNDGTLLNYAVKQTNCNAFGVDPSLEKFAEFYDNRINKICDFFNLSNIHSLIPSSSVSLVTSISMFYDLDDPVAFSKDVASILSANGIWYLEQSYLPSMLDALSFDTICHEHYEYYTLSIIIEILARAGLRVIDVCFNDINGGSFGVTCCKESSSLIPVNPELISWIIHRENHLQLKSVKSFKQFVKDVEIFREQFHDLLLRLRKGSKHVAALGASTKGNVLLQYCCVDSTLIRSVGEVNPFKFNRFTPGSNIPIIPEAQLLNQKPDYLLVLPWHFRDTFRKKLKSYINNGGKVIFPLPDMSIF